jgi:hypothetical protein
MSYSERQSFAAREKNAQAKARLLNPNPPAAEPAPEPAPKPPASKPAAAQKTAVKQQAPKAKKAKR